MANASPKAQAAAPAVGVAAARGKRGYQLEIFEQKQDREKYSCGFCAKILREPMQACCGHRFCKNCRYAIEEAGRAGETVYCRLCKAEGYPDNECVVDPEKMNIDKGIMNEMRKIQAKCPNEMCIYARQFIEYIKHEEECKYQPLMCEKCGEEVSKQKIDRHLSQDCPQRSVTCRHCQEEMTRARLESHLKQCPSIPVQCGQCSRQVPQNKMERHLHRDCPNRVVQCPLEGCTAPQTANRFHQHLQKDISGHLAWVVSRIADLDTVVTTHLGQGGTSETSGGDPALNMVETLESLMLRVGEMERQLQERVGTARSSGSGGGGGGGGDGGGGGGAPVASGGADVPGPASRIDAMEMKVDSLEPILSVLHGEINRCITALESATDKIRQGEATVRQVEENVRQKDSLIRNLSTTDRQQETKIKHLEERFRSFGQDVPDGCLLWSIPNFSQVRRDAIAGTILFIDSHPFYTGPIGYKMKARMYPNGDGAGKGTHLSLYMAIMRGYHDSLLPWPFKQNMHFMIIDQNSKKHMCESFRSNADQRAFQRPTSEMNPPTGSPTFMKLTQVSQSGVAYLRDDTMFVQIFIDPQGLEEHMKQFDPRNGTLLAKGPGPP